MPCAFKRSFYSSPVLPMWEWGSHWGLFWLVFRSVPFLAFGVWPSLLLSFRAHISGAWPTSKMSAAAPPPGGGNGRPPHDNGKPPAQPPPNGADGSRKRPPPDADPDIDDDDDASLSDLPDVDVDEGEFFFLSRWSCVDVSFLTCCFRCSVVSRSLPPG